MGGIGAGWKSGVDSFFFSKRSFFFFKKKKL